MSPLIHLLLVSFQVLYLVYFNLLITFLVITTCAYPFDQHTLVYIQNISSLNVTEGEITFSILCWFFLVLGPICLTASIESSHCKYYPIPSPAPVPLLAAHHYLSLKLGHHNYLLWKAQLNPFLTGQGLQGFNDGSYLCPPRTVISSSISTLQPNPAYVVWVQ